MAAAGRQDRCGTEVRASTRSWRRSTSTGPGIEETGELRERRVRRAADEIETIALAALRARMGDLGGHAAASTSWPRDVVAGRTDPYAAADRLVAAARV